MKPSMKKRNQSSQLGLALTLALPLLTAAFGCTADNPASMNPDDPNSGGPHALGQITLGEFHASGGGSATPVVSALFVPDSKLIKKCTTTIAGCEVQKAPVCGTDPGTGCKLADGEVCQYDDSCQPRCVKACAAKCATDEECYFASPDSPSCRKRETFDAGSLAFAGTTTTLTLFPPYSYTSKGSGAPFLEKASLTVNASGATGAGFDTFQQTFGATTYLRTEPAISKLTRGQVFGSGTTVPVKWVAGEDKVQVTVTGIDGTAVCEAMDAAGSFDIPREVVSAVLGERTDVTQQLAIAVSRQKLTLQKGLKTKGALLTQTVQPEGWLQLTTTSTESASLQGCGRGTGLCGGDMCIDLTSDEQNCGKCGSACNASDSCRNSKCCGPAACDSCVASAETTTCKADASACSADTAANGCAVLRVCVNACTTQTCRNMCGMAATQAAINQLNKLNNCLRTACTSACSC